MAYNGASAGGVIMSPLWALLIFRYSFLAAACLIGAVMIPAVLVMSFAVFAKTPEQLGQAPDHDAPASSPGPAGPPHPCTPPAASLWRDRSFATLTAAMALGLFAQIGLIAHLFSVLAPRLGDQAAGWAMTAVTAASIVGRLAAGRAMSAGADRRRVACVSYSVQLAGSLVLAASAGVRVPLLLAGITLLGCGVGNATSLPPLIAQREFAGGDVQRVIARAIAVSQGTYAFAPLVFGVLIGSAGHVTARSPGAGVTTAFAAAALVQAAAAGSVMIGRRHRDTA
jgi:MFS family permease